MVENFKNNSETTLNGAINDSVTTITVADSSQLPSADFRIKIDNELLLCTGVAGNDLTVTRGIEGTTAAAHGSTTRVTHVLTAGALDAFHGDSVLINDSLPSVDHAGQLNFADGHIACSDASNWTPFSLIHKWVKPPTDNWSWVSQDTATATATPVGQLLKYTGTTGYYRCYSRPFDISIAGDYQVTAGFIHNLLPGNNSYAGIGLHRQSNGKIISLFQDRGQIHCQRVTFSGSWSFNGTDATTNVAAGLFSGMVFFRMSFVSNAVYIYLSCDKRNWVQLRGSGISYSHFGNLAPDEFIFLIGKTTGSSEVSAHLVYYEEETL